MAVNVNETEIKYGAPAGAGLPRPDWLPRVAVASGPEEQRLEAGHYDTDDLRLLRAGITLRQRSGGDDAGRLQGRARHLWKKASRRLGWPF
jgi:inorganic triphosphatase YgiF